MILRRAGMIACAPILYLLSNAQVPGPDTPSLMLSGHQGGVTGIKYSPDGRWFASSSLDDTVRLWDTASRQTARVLEGHRDEVYDVAFSPDGRYVASTGYDRRVLLWECISGKLVRTFEGFPDWSVAVAVSPDGKNLAVGRQEGAIEIYDLMTAKSLGTLVSKEPFYSVSAPAYSPDEVLLCTNCIMFSLILKAHWNK